MILYSNSLRLIFTDRNYFVFKFLKDLYSQYEYNMGLILTELILCSNCFKLVFMNHNYFVFKLPQTCIHESQLFCVQIASNLYSWIAIILCSNFLTHVFTI